MAKRSKLPEDWKRYLKELRQERVAWQKGRLEAAASNWQVYRDIVKPRRERGVDYLLNTKAVNPTEDIRNHFEEVHVGEGDEGLDAFLHSLAEGLQGEAEPIRESEVYLAVKEGKPNKSVGDDLVSSELLSAIVDKAEGLRGLTAFFQDILSSGTLPAKWRTSIVKLLPKTKLPDTPKQLRPISLSSHAAKCLTRLLLGRVQHVLLPAGAQQLAAKHRHAVDFVFSARRVLQLCKEWGISAVMLKTDIKKAFDVVNRRSLAKRLVGWLGSDFPQEAVLFLKLLQTNAMSFVLPWQSFQLLCCRGVRQGSTESPGLFSKLLDCVLCETAAKVNTRLFEDLSDEAASFMDDILAWQGTVPQMQVYADHLVRGLAAEGMQLQPEKCQLLCIGDTQGRSIKLGGVELKAMEEGQCLSIMNTPVSLHTSDYDLVTFLLDKAHQKFHAPKRFCVVEHRSHLV